MINSLRNFLFDKEYGIAITENCLYITNYHKIGTIEETLLKIELVHAYITIKGNHLTIHKLLDKEIEINGQIVSMEFTYK